MKLDGKLAFLPMDSDPQEASALSKAPSTIPVIFTGQRIDLPETP
jgi:hypothetical protein